MNNRVIKRDLEHIPSYVEDYYFQLNQLNTCFAFLVHSTSTFLCSTVSFDSPDWFNDFLFRVNFKGSHMLFL